MRRTAIGFLVCLLLAACEGPMGPEGPKGDKGDTGAQGPAGPQGQTGQTGQTGPQGPPGAQGLRGPIGPQGPAGTTKVVLTSTIDATGGAGVFFPVEVGNNALRPPAFACYVAIPAATPVWFLVTDGYNSSASPVCGVTYDSTRGRWYAGIIRGVPGDYVAFVVVY